MHKLKVLILFADYGEGHQQAARAIQEAFTQMDVSVEVRTLNYMHMVHPLLNSVARYCLLQSVRYLPSLYGFFYQQTGNIKPSSRIQTYLNQLGIDVLEEYIDNYKPDIVLSTFPTPAGVMSMLKDRKNTQILTATVITDHAVHNQWIHLFTDMYFVGSEYVKKELLSRGVQENKIYVTGIPIRSSFNAPIKRNYLSSKYGLDPILPTILVMGGSYGVLSDITNICEELMEYTRPLQLLIVCGQNEKLYSDLKDRLKYGQNMVKIFGFTNKIHELMAVSDVMITKAGGLTISEALAMELPMLLYRPIPGQELKNAELLVEAKVALLARTRKQFSEHLNLLLQTESMDILQIMKKNTKRIKRPFAATQIVDHVMERFMAATIVNQSIHSL